MPRGRKTLLRIYGALIVTYVAAEFAVTLLPIHPYQTPTEILSAYQAERSDAVRGGDVVLLGDSSLGNAVDGAALSAAVGVPCHNLALVALFGPRGDEVMQRRIFSRARQGLPRAIVVMHKPTNWDHRSDAEAVRQLRNSVGAPSLDRFAHANFSRLPSVERSRSYRSIFFTYRTGLRYDPTKYERALATSEEAAAAITELGYVPQHGTAELNPASPPPLGEFTPAESSADNLRNIFSLAQGHGVQVYLAIGPYWQASVEVSGEFVAQLDAWLRGLAGEYPNVSLLYSGVPATPDKYIGDTLEHLNSAGRAEFTRWLAPLLEARLAGDHTERPAGNWAGDAPDPG